MILRDGIDCDIYQKHHNTINGIYMIGNPSSWDEVDYIDEIDTEPEDGVNHFENMLNDLNVYDLDKRHEEYGFYSPDDIHHIPESIFIIRSGNTFFLCETQKAHYVKFSTNITKTNWVKQKLLKSKLNMI